MNPIVEYQEKSGMIARAKSYPFLYLPFSYLYINGVFYPHHGLWKEDFEDDSLILKNSVYDHIDKFWPIKKYLSRDFMERIPVLAYGSNAAIDQLQRKFADFNEFVFIPVIKAKLWNFDVVYSPCFSSYGSVPATLQYSAGTEVDVFVTFLTPQQLQRMHVTEGMHTGNPNYFFARFDDIDITLVNNIEITSIFTYLSTHGCLSLNESEVSLKSIFATNRKFPSYDQCEVLCELKNYFHSEKELDDFIYENILDDKISELRSERLKSTAKKMQYTHLHMEEYNDELHNFK